MKKILLNIELGLRTGLTFIAALVPSFLIVAVGLGAIGIVSVIAIALLAIFIGLFSIIVLPLIVVFFTVGFACVLTAAYTEKDTLN